MKDGDYDVPRMRGDCESQWLIDLEEGHRNHVVVPQCRIDTCFEGHTASWPGIFTRQTDVNKTITA